MTNISLDLSNKIPTYIIEVIESVQKIADKMNISIFLIGATARDLVLQYGYGLPKSAATRDIDFGVAVENWSEYNELKESLIETEKFRQVLKIEHRMLEIQTNTEVDIVPFENIESEDGKIIWQESKREMKIAGFVESYESALDVKLSEGLIIKVVSPVCFAVLKLLAWDSRHENKDSLDFWLVVKNYLNISDNEDRIYESHFDWLEDADYDYEIVGAKLLGADITGIFLEKTISIILNILSNEKKMESLSLEIDRFEKTVDDNFERIQEILQMIKVGIKISS